MPVPWRRRIPAALRSTAISLATLWALAAPSGAAVPGSDGAGPAGSSGPPPGLRVSGNGRYLESAGTPFFWVGDTAWYALKLDREALDRYLLDRRGKGFNVIQGPILIDRDGAFPIAPGDIGALRPNAAGDRPFLTTRPLIPNGPYWRQVDHFVRRAGELGFYVVLPLLWGPEIDTFFGSQRQRLDYVDFVVRRYAGQSHVIWMVTGEWHKVAWRSARRDERVPSREQIAMISQLGRRVAARKGPDQLVTIHPDGHRSSGREWHRRRWLDFNMVQGFDSFGASAAEVAADWRRTPAKPTLQAELCYEGAPACGKGSWYPRMSAYLSAFGGSLGYTYGHHAVWSFSAAAADGSNGWLESLDEPGARQVGGYFRALMAQYHGNDRIPDQSALVTGSGRLQGEIGDDDFVAVTRDRGGRYLLAYSSHGRAFRLDTRMLAAEVVRARWFDPRYGTFLDIGHHPRSGDRRYDPPGEPAAGNDYVLVLDAVAGTNAVAVAGGAGEVKSRAPGPPVKPPRWP